MKDRIRSGLAYAVALFLFGAAFSVAAAGPTEVGLPQLEFLGGPVAILIYTFWFALLGITLILVTAFDRTSIKRYTLFATYLTMLFIFTLEAIHLGWSLYVLDGPVLALICGYLWITTERGGPGKYKKRAIGG